MISAALEPDGVWETRELEVSSPGMDQPLRVYQQYLRRIGRQARVISREGREYKGLIKSADDEGFTLTESVSRKENKTKIIAVTADAMKGARERCIDAGMNDYISKPVDIEKGAIPSKHYC